uniref:Uncharacterized protein n=1 Tax=Romanomermis culicivorax TaxID=13658 RepID=A0A915I1V6_ROMCU
MTGCQSTLNQNGFDAAKLNRLRRTLYEAEKDVLCKQAEIETLQRTFLSDLDQDMPRRRCSLLTRDRSCSSLSQNRRESFTSFPPRKLASDMALNVSYKNDVPIANGNSIFQSRRLNSTSANQTTNVENGIIRSQMQANENISESIFIERSRVLLLVKEEIDFMKQLLHTNLIENRSDSFDFHAQISSLEKILADLNAKNLNHDSDELDFVQIFKSLTELRKYFAINCKKSSKICDKKLLQMVNLTKLNTVIDNYDEFFNKNSIFAQFDRANLISFKKILESEGASDQKLNISIFLLIREIAFCKLELLAASKAVESQNFEQFLAESGIFDQCFDASLALKSGINAMKFNQMSIVAILKSRYMEYRALKSKVDQLFSPEKEHNDVKMFLDNESIHKLRDLFEEASLNSEENSISDSNKNRANYLYGNYTKFNHLTKNQKYLENLLSKFDFVKDSNIVDENVDLENSIQSCVWEILFIDLNPEIFRRIIKTYFAFANEKIKGDNGCSERQQLQSEVKFETERRKLQNEIHHLKSIVEVASNNQHLDKEIAELEQELVEIQAACNDEIRILKDFYESKLFDKEKELQEEKNRRKKLTKDMLAMKTLNDDSLQAILKNQTDLMSELKKKHLKEISRISNDYEQKLFEEKEATKFALDALQKAHEVEMNNQMIKLRLQHQQLSSSPHNDSELASFEMCAEKKRYKKIQNAVEKENEEISRLTMAYSAKCIEITMLEDYLSEYRSIFDKKFNECDSEESIEILRSLIADINKLDENLLKEQVQKLSTSACDVTIPLKVGNHQVMQNSTPESGQNVQTAVTDHSFDYENEVTPTKRNVPLRRHSERYHSTPNIRREIDCRSMMTVYPEILEEMKSTGVAPVSERRKYFEHFK